MVVGMAPAGGGLAAVIAVEFGGGKTVQRPANCVYCGG